MTTTTYNLEIYADININRNRNKNTNTWMIWYQIISDIMVDFDKSSNSCFNQIMWWLLLVLFFGVLIIGIYQIFHENMRNHDHVNHLPITLTHRRRNGMSQANQENRSERVQSEI